MQRRLEIIKGKNSFHTRCFLPNLLHLFIHVFIIHKNQLHLGIVQDIFQFIDTDGGINGGEHCADLLHG